MIEMSANALSTSKNISEYPPEQNTVSEMDGWNITLADSHQLVRDVLASRDCRGNETDASSIQNAPLIVRLMESPDWHFPGLTLFHGAVKPQNHIYIHILLGRGHLPKDEAFCLGFAMGSTHRVSAMEQEAFCAINQWLYPKAKRFHDEELAVFRDGIRVGMLSNCQSLDDVNFSDFDHATIGGMRTALGVEEDLLGAYYRIEQQRYPSSPESQRLMP